MESTESPDSPPRKEQTCRRPLYPSDLPRFEETNVIHWLKQITNIFKLYSVYDPKERVKLLSTILPSNLGAKIKFPLSEDCYEELLEELQKEYTPCLRDRVRSVFKDGMKAEESPSEYMERVKEALGYSNYVLLSENDGRFMRELFLSEMPIQIQMSLTTMVEKAPIGEMVRVADNMYKIFCSPDARADSYPRKENKWGEACGLVTNTPDTVSNKRRETSAGRDEIREIMKVQNQLLEQMKELTRNINRMTESFYSERSRTPGYQGNSYRGRSSSRGRSGNPARNQEDEQLCYFHQKFNYKSFRCAGNGCLMAPLIKANQKNTTGRTEEIAERNSGNL